MKKTPLFFQKKQSSFFTLIELLLVIAIIMLLMAIIMPALGKTHALARQLQCAGNLKQIGLSIYTYLDDNQVYFPHQKWDYLTSSGAADTKRWQSFIQEYLGIKGPYYALSTIKRNSVFYCPVAEANNSVWYNYQINRSVCPSLDTKTGTAVYSTFGAFRLTNIKKTTRTLLITDGLPGQEFIDSLRLSDPLISNRTVSYRHREGTNVLFVDGHVNWMKPTRVPQFILSSSYLTLDVAFQDTCFPGKPLYE
ncbi:MAG: hypothetical protein A2X49_08105 [Lentisphaerae bacterium GWF2_52_8]|nr:MAG: hypothetical protein A2X49_08105 [Lentisphaerae bacterium GWF2_52_8]